MNILQVVHGFAPEFIGGTESYVQRLSKEILAAGHSCSVFAGSGEETENTVITESLVDGLSVLRLCRNDRFRDQWFASASADAEHSYIQVLQRLQPDLIHIHHWTRLCRSLVRAATYSGIPAVVTLHDVWTTCLRGDRLLGSDLCSDPLIAATCASCAGGLPHHSSGELAQEGRFFLRDLRHELLCATKIMTPTLALAEFIKEALGCDELEIEKRSLPVPSSDLQGGRRDDSPDKPLRIVYWGHLDPGKGGLLLAEAVTRLASENRRVTLDLYGDSISNAFREQVRNELLGADCSGSVVFHGAFRPTEIDSSRYDVAVFPSFYFESHSFVVDEAWSLGLPVVLPNRGAFPERLHDQGGGGVLFEAGDASDLARTLASLQDAPSYLNELRNGARCKGPSWKEHLEAILSSYRAAMKAPVVAPSGWAPPRPSERWIERKLYRREPLIEKLTDDNRVIEMLHREVEAHKNVIRGLEAEVVQHRTSLKVVTEDLALHREVLHKREEELASHQEALHTIEKELADHRDVLFDREARLRDYETVVKEHEHFRSEYESVLATLNGDLAQHRDVVTHLKEEEEKKRQVIADLETDLAGHRKLVSVVAHELEELAEVARKVLPRRRKRTRREGENSEGENATPGGPLTPSERIVSATNSIRERFRKQLKDGFGFHGRSGKGGASKTG